MDNLESLIEKVENLEDRVKILERILNSMPQREARSVNENEGEKVKRKCKFYVDGICRFVGICPYIGMEEVSCT